MAVTGGIEMRIKGIVMRLMGIAFVPIWLLIFFVTVSLNSKPYPEFERRLIDYCILFSADFSIGTMLLICAFFIVQMIRGKLK